jgi:RNA polymerase sigma-70 factor (ECF subfamily)
MQPCDAIVHSTGMDQDDQALVAAFLAARSEDVFLTLYERHSPVVFGLARRLVGTADADDVLQDTWLRAIAGLASFAWSSSLRTWLCGIAVNCCRERWRRQLPSIDSEPVLAPADPERALDLEDALSRLSPGYRAVVVLHDVYGYTHAEIGELLGVEAGTSKSQLARGRQALRALLGAVREGAHHGK